MLTKITRKTHLLNQKKYNELVTNKMEVSVLSEIMVFIL